MKAIHSSQIWRGAVIALKRAGMDDGPQVWYFVEYVDERVIHLTAMHTGVTYERPISDRWVWLSV